MISFVVTGATGLLGGNLAWEIIKNNISSLAEIRLFWFGRDTASCTLEKRIAQKIKEDCFSYLAILYDEYLYMKILACIVPIRINFTSDNLDLSENDFERLKESPIDYFYHVAALTDFRHTENVAKILDETNFMGTQRILRLIENLPHKVGLLLFVSSAYVCGKTYGSIAPNYINLNQEFRNPYEKSKLKAEMACREFCKSHNIKLTVFRPSTISGRMIESPLGHVTKYDVFYAWLAFFLGIKKQLLVGIEFAQLYSTNCSIPIRVLFNKAIGLNIVPADFCAKVMYATAVSDRKIESLHLVSQQDLSNPNFFKHLLEILNIMDCTYSQEMPQGLSRLERLYYKTVGAVFTPYITGDEMHFEHAELDALCQDVEIPIANIGNHNFQTVVSFAKNNYFGLKQIGTV